MSPREHARGVAAAADDCADADTKRRSVRPALPLLELRNLNIFPHLVSVHILGGRGGGGAASAAATCARSGSGRRHRWVNLHERTLSDCQGGRGQQGSARAFGPTTTVAVRCPVPLAAADKGGTPPHGEPTPYVRRRLRDKADSLRHKSGYLTSLKFDLRAVLCPACSMNSSLIDLI